MAAETAVGKLSHRNVVKLIGIMATGKVPPHYVCTLCENGPLSAYLPKHVWSGFLPGREAAITQQLMGFAMQIASGLECETRHLPGRPKPHAPKASANVCLARSLARSNTHGRGVGKGARSLAQLPS